MSSADVTANTLIPADQAHEAAVETSGFFRGMVRGAEVAPGVTMYASPHMRRAYSKFDVLKEEAIRAKGRREELVKNEAVVMGDTILPIGAEIVLVDMPKEKAVAKIIGVSAGYGDRPLYEVILRNADGTYPEGRAIVWGENNMHVYARDMVDFGLTILQGVSHVV